MPEISEMKIKKILIVADDSLPSTKAVQFGFGFARDLGAKVMLLSVIEPALTLGNPDAGIFPDDALIAARAKTAEFLKRMKDDYAQSVKTELTSPEGEVGPIVMKVIADWHANLVVMGAHGRTGVSKLLTGSVADSIVGLSPVPVCVVPMDK